MASKHELLQWSFITLLVGGVLILVGGLMGSLMMGWWGGWWMGGGMMGPGHMAGTTEPPAGWFWTMALWMGLWSLLTGGAVVLAAVRIRVDPSKASTWGTVAIVAGALSLVSMGGWLLGAVGAIVGGALAVVAGGREEPVRAPSS